MPEGRGVGLRVPRLNLRGLRACLMDLRAGSAALRNSPGVRGIALGTRGKVLNKNVGLSNSY